MHYFRYYFTLLISSGLWFLMDQWSKNWATQAHLPWGNPEHFFYLSQVTHNSGIAFGLPLPRWIQLLSTLAILVFLIYTGHTWLQKNRKWFLQAMILGIVLGGALGNFWDRLRQGYVVDFIVLKPFPTLNIADVGITVGLVLLVWIGWKTEKENDLSNIAPKN